MLPHVCIRTGHSKEEDSVGIALDIVTLRVWCLKISLSYGGVHSVDFVNQRLDKRV